MDYTPEQLAAIQHHTGPLCVVAAAGSGKTAVLTARIANLIRQHGVAPDAILAVTFTRAAADEMRSRLAAQIGEPAAKKVALRTFHGLAYAILTEVEGRLTLWGDGEPLRALGGILRELGLPADQSAVQNCETDLADYRGRMVRLADYRPASCAPEHFRSVVDRYQEAKRAAGVLDFDDLLERTLSRLTDEPMLRDRLRRRWQFVLVDEFQDTNLLQARLIEQLVSDQHDIMVVGDDDQAIYGWRGSEVRFILDFPRRYPGCRVIHLPTNYRTTAALLAPAAALIQQNRQRFAKALAAARPAGMRPQVARPETPRDEDDALLSLLTAARVTGADLEQYAVLYRQHTQAIGLINRLARAGIPHRLLAGDADPFATWPARDALAYLRWAWGDASLEEVTRVLRRPLRGGMNKEAVSALEAAIRQPAEALSWLAANAPAVARQLQGAFETIRHTPAERAIDVIRYELDYDAYIRDFCLWSGADRREAQGLLEAIQAMPEVGESSRVYLELTRPGQGGARRKRATAQETPGPAVTLSTFHSAKGREWEHVYLKGALEGTTPTRKAIDSGDVPLMEEERRLFYVAMTRAKESLTVFCARNQYGAAAVPSRFVSEAGLLPSAVSRPTTDVRSACAERGRGKPVTAGASRPVRRPGGRAADAPELDLTLSHRLKKLQGTKYFVPNERDGAYYKQPSVDGTVSVRYRGSSYRQCIEIEPDALLDMLSPAERE